MMDKQLRCPCGGKFTRVTDSLSVEAGGVTATLAWSEDHCDQCGSTVEEAVAATSQLAQIPV